jgi:hypothetical protein
MVAAWAGPFTERLGDSEPASGLAVPATAAPVSPGRDDEVLVAFDRLAGCQPVIGLLGEALARVSRRRQQRILFEFRLQAVQGDPSPAVTVARHFEMSPNAVRQTCKRVLDRVRRLAEEDQYFAPLAALPMLERQRGRRRDTLHSASVPPSTGRTSG